MKVYTDNTKANFGFTITVQFVDDNGTAIDISSATTKELVFVPPSGSAVVKTAAFTTNGTDGKIQYTVEATLFLTPGNWSFYGVADANTAFSKATATGSVVVEFRTAV